MTGERTAFWHRFTGLSARLLLLTTFFVMLSEVFIYAPSIGRFRLVYMEERIAAAHLASLALEMPTDNMVSAGLRHELLDHAGSYGIVLRRPASKALILSRDMPPRIDATFDIGDRRFFALIMEAFITLAGDGDRILRITGISPKNPRVIVETVISEVPLRDAMLAYSARIMALSVAISLMTAVLVYLSLQWLFVRPMRAITASMVAFQQDPEDGRRVMVPGRRSDEIGIARRELAGMQEGLRAALQQKARLAALGTAVTKINHDLRNILATARLVSDHVESSEDPNVRRIAPTLLGAIDRAITLCSQTLGFAQEGTPAPRLSRFPLALLMAEVAAEASGLQARTVAFDNRIEAGFEIFADREQMFRVLSNLVRNAFEAGAGKVTVGAAEAGSAAIIEIADDGPGLPPKVRENLFQPFAGSGRVGGTGLGLAIARDLLRGHGGSIELVSTGADGTVFRLILPMDQENVVDTRMQAERPPGWEGDAP
jgi:signal transduction histidine kinase